MTSTITEVTIRAITSGSFDGPSTGVGAIAIIFLVVLLILKEIVRTLKMPRTKVWMQTLDIAIVPFLLVFGFVIIIRFLRL